VSRKFNTTGPCLPDQHYMVPALARCPEVTSLIENGHYFVLHAPRQTGKTTLVQELQAELEREDRFSVLYCSMETAQDLHGEDAFATIVETLAEAILNHSVLHDSYLPEQNGSSRLPLLKLLRRLSRDHQKPLVVLFDEVDCLEGTTLVSFLRQLRNGYVERGRIPFPHAIGLVGMRNIRDYKARIRPGRETLGGASPFNIVQKTLTLESFSRDELGMLLAEHASDTGQTFPDTVTDLIHARTNGQPWLCNAIAREITEDLLDGDSRREITVASVEKAIENNVLRRDSHIDSLLERLREPRVRRILEPVILGDQPALTFTDDDAAYTFDLGLLRMNKGDVVPANPIYGEIIMRALSYDAQHRLPVTLEGRFISGDRLDMGALMTAFQQFWREKSAIWTEKYDYKEAAPHLILQAFLQRVVNGGGTIQREYSAGRGRIDLCITLGDHRYPIELKIRRDTGTREQGIDQLSVYLDSLGVSEGWLVHFDRNAERDWSEKLFTEDIEYEGKLIHLIGC